MVTLWIWHGTQFKVTSTVSYKKIFHSQFYLLKDFLKKDPFKNSRKYFLKSKNGNMKCWWDEIWNVDEIKYEMLMGWNIKCWWDEIWNVDVIKYEMLMGWNMKCWWDEIWNVDEIKY